MDAEPIGALAALAGGCLVLTALLPILSALLERSGPIRLLHWVQETGGALQRLYESPVRFEVFRYLLSWLAKLVPVCFFVLCGALLQRLGWGPAMLGAGVATALTLALAELVNRALVGRDPERALRGLTGTFRVAHLLLIPLVAVLTPLMPGLAVERREDEDEVTDGEIEAFISVGTQEGILEPGEEDLIMRVIDFGDSVVKSVVTPRIDMICAPVESDLDSLAELFLSSKHSRIPVFRATVDEVVGILHIRDLLRGLRAGEAASAEELAMPPFFVPESKPLNDLLREFQAQRQQVAIVVDEYGGTSGLVTVEDLLEEIVGEITDEHDEDLPLNEPLPDGRWRLDGSVALEELENLFEVEVEDEQYETLGGLIFDRLGYVPKPGERVESHGLVFQVERVEGRRIKSVLVGRTESESEAKP